MKTRLATPGWNRSANFYWAVGGNVGYLFFQWCVITFLAQVAGPGPVGVYSFALTLTAPFQMFLTFRMAFLQSTDVNSRFGFRTYSVVRILSVSVGGILLALGVAFLDVSDELRWAILWIGLAKLLDMYSGLYFGHFQRNERMDLVSSLRVVNGALTLFLMMASWYLWDDLAAALAATAAASLITNGLALWVLKRKCPVPQEDFARPTSRVDITALFGLGLPLGIASGIVSLEAFLPRFFILGSLGEHELGVYSALGYTTLLMTTFVNALGNSIAPKLGRVTHEQGLQATDRLCRTYTRIIVLVTLVGSITALLIGDPLVRLVYGPDFAGFRVLLALLVISGGIQSMVLVQEWFATVAKRVVGLAKIQVVTFALSVAGGYLAAQTGSLTSFGILSALKVAIVLVLYLVMRRQILTSDRSHS